MTIDVVAEGRGWLAVNKPHGASFHSEDGTTGFFAQAEATLRQKLWPVHRLDKVTSGLLIVATTQEMAAHLSAQFAQRTTTKFYLAVSEQRPKKKQGIIKGDMSKSRGGNYRLLRTQHNPAKTRFISYYDENTARRLFLLRPETGKTHQLRVAMKSIGAPILGDQRYGGSDAERTCLHAWSLRFSDDQQEHTLFCPPEGPIWPTIPDDWSSPYSLID